MINLNLKISNIKTVAKLIIKLIKIGGDNMRKQIVFV